MDAQRHLLLSMRLSRVSGGPCDWNVVRLLHKSELNIVALDGFRQLFREKRVIPYDPAMGIVFQTSSSKRVGSKILREDNLLLSLLYPLDKRIILVTDGLVQTSMFACTGHTSGCEEQ
jgi:hypothetical protein